MTDTPEIDVRDLESVRKAARAPDLVLGDDWVAPQALGENELEAGRRKRGLFSLHSSPIARKIVTFNLIALMLLIAGILYLDSSRDNLVYQRITGLAKEAELIGDVIEANLPFDASVNLESSDGLRAIAGLSEVTLRDRIQVLVFDPNGTFIGTNTGTGNVAEVQGLEDVSGSTAIIDTLSGMFSWAARSAGLGRSEMISNRELLEAARNAVPSAKDGTTHFFQIGEDANPTYLVATPIERSDRVVGVAVVATAAGELDQLIAQEREKVLRLFLVGIMISIGLSLVLASTIANPLADLAAAAEIGRDKNARKLSPTKVRIPDLTARPDEIGRLSGALRGMVQALYERIEGNEQFAADVAHEIKNPLASLRSAAGTLRIAKRDRKSVV